MDFRVLGSIEVWEAERQLALGSPKQRALLGQLLLSAGAVVTVDELTDALWVGDPPPSADHAIEVYVSRLRKILHSDGRTRLVTKDGGYVLDVDSDNFDARMFEELFSQGRAELARGRAQSAANLLEEALSLWRGEPLTDAGDGLRVRAAVGRLQELRWSALEERIDADLACGRQAGLVAELETLVAAEPLRERFRAQLMLALYRDGRQADALRRYHAARTMLLDELGLEPSRALQELERAILTQDPSLDLRPSRDLLAPVPASLTPLVGRVVELEQITELVLSDGVRLVTITGTGGIGKTRLALEAARRLEADFEDGVAFVDLAHVRAPELVVQAIADALGVHEQPGTSLLERLTDSVSQRTTLLVVDNFEHVLDAAPIVSQLLAASDKLKVVATSRTRLRLYGEHEYAVLPLRLPPVGERSVDELLRYEAIELFVGCAQRRRPGFALDLTNAPDVAAVCIRLDGVPLAIELAAGRTTVFEPAALLQQLTSRLPILVDGPRDVPERQQSLRATIDWSYDLLAPEECRLLRNLSVFSAGFTVEACAAVCCARRSTLESLVEKNLVTREVGTRERYSLLETIREYGLERLQETRTLDQMRLRHAEYFVALAAQADPELRGPNQLEWFERMDAEQSNVWTAFRWALAADRFELPLRIGAALWRHWEARGSLTEARRRLDDALERSTGQELEARAPALFASGRMALRHGDLDRARAVFGEALTLFEAADERCGVALCTAGIGWVAHVVGPVEDAVSLCEDAVALARAADEDWVIADALNNLGVALRSAGDLERSRKALEESLAIRRRIGELEGVTAALNGLALIAIAEDNFDEAERLFADAFALSEQRGDLFYAAAKDVVLAYLAFGRGDLKRATNLSTRALESCRLHGYQQFAAYALETLAGVAAAEGRARQAARVLGAAVAVAERLGRASPGRSEGVTYDWEARAVKRVLDETRRSLGDAQWTAAMDDGRHLQLAEVLAFAEEWTAEHEYQSRSRHDEGAATALPL